MSDIGIPELLIIAFIIVLLFGSKKLPGAAKSIGQSLKIFKDETKGLRHGNDDDQTTAAQAPVALPAGTSVPVEPPAAAPTAPLAQSETPPVTTPHA